MSSDKVSMNQVQRAPAAQPQAKPVAERPVADKPEKQQASPPAGEAVQEVAKRIESYLRSVSRSLEFRVDSASGRTVVSVRDSQTGDLIRQIPSEEVLRLAEMAQDETIVLINESA